VLHSRSCGNKNNHTQQRSWGPFEFDEDGRDRAAALDWALLQVKLQHAAAVQLAAPLKLNHEKNRKFALFPHETDACRCGSEDHKAEQQIAFCAEAAFRD
jgi:hypothetical protein